MKMRMVSLVIGAALWAAAVGVQASLINGDFETGDFTGWTLFTTSSNGTVSPHTVALFDTNNDATATKSAQFRVGQVNHNLGGLEGGGIFQSVLLGAGILNLSADIAVAAGSLNNVEGGLFDLLLDGIILASHNFGSTSAGVDEFAVLAASTSVTAGSHEIRIQMRRNFTNQNSLLQWVDNVAASGPSVPAPEPTTLALMGLALAGLGFQRRKAA